jgi:hypothetical protein
VATVPRPPVAMAAAAMSDLNFMLLASRGFDNARVRAALTRL